MSDMIEAMRLRAVPRAIHLAGGDKPTPPAKIQIMRAGQFHHPEYGTFSITEETFASMVKNFNDGVRGIDLAVDYQHASEDIAAGWFKKLYVEPDADGVIGLYADVAWTPKGAAVLTDREFRYLSADFTMNYVDNETLDEFGPTLNGAGLTNRPFIKGMDPAVELTEGKGTQHMKTVEQLTAEVKKLSDAADVASKALGGKDAADVAKELSQAREQIAALQSKVKELETTSAQLSEAKAKAEKGGKFDKMLSEGKAVEAQREAFMGDDMIKFAELAKPVNLKPAGTGAGGGTAVEPTNKAEAETKIQEIAHKMLSEKKVSSLSEATRRALSENPTLAALYNSTPAGKALR